MKILATLIIFCIPFIATSQIQNGAQWSFSVKKTGNKTYELYATASIEAGWHIYSQVTGKGGPVPTNFTFVKNPLIHFIGSVKEMGKMEKKFDKTFNTSVKSYSDKVIFSQIIKLKANIKTNVTGHVEYMACNDKNCLPPKKVSFDVTLQ